MMLSLNWIEKALESMRRNKAIYQVSYPSRSVASEIGIHVWEGRELVDRIVADYLNWKPNSATKLNVNTIALDCLEVIKLLKKRNLPFWTPNLEYVEVTTNGTEK